MLINCLRFGLLPLKANINVSVQHNTVSGCQWRHSDTTFAVTSVSFTLSVVIRCKCPTAGPYDSSADV